MKEVVASGTVRLDGTKDGDGAAILCNFKGTEDVKKLTIDLGPSVRDIPYKDDLFVEVTIEKKQMTLDDVADNGGAF